MKDTYYYWFISYWACAQSGHGVWGFGNCVYRQKNVPILNVQQFQQDYQADYSSKFPGQESYLFVVCNYHPITEEEFAYNGEIAFTKPGDAPEKSYDQMTPEEKSVIKAVIECEAAEQPIADN